MERDPVVAPLGTGVRAMDALLTCGRGQRIGLFGGSGVGKSTLLGMMTRGTAADVIVMALVGERGREVRSFIEHDLGPEGMRNGRWSSCRRPTTRRCCACARPTRPRRSPSTSAIRARTSCC